MDNINRHSGQGDTQICLQNIGPAGSRKRMRFGAVLFGLSLMLAALLLLLGSARWWRLVLFFPLAGSAIGFFQARDKT